MRVSLWMAALAAVAIGCGDNKGTGGTGGTGTGGTGGAVDAAMVDAPTVMCNPVDQTGCTGSTPKCALEAPATNFELDCAMGGTVMTGQPCTRLSDVPGDDNCANGYCSAYDTNVSGGRVCRRYCSLTNNTCASNEACWGMLDPYGRCVRTCNPFSSNTCPQGNTLVPVQVCDWAINVNNTSAFGTCLQGGTATMGANCNLSATPAIGCQQGLTCLGDMKCHPLCETMPGTQHPCPAGQMCLTQYLTGNMCVNGACSGTGEMCDTASGMCFIDAPGPNGGGYCVNTPDAGGAAMVLLPKRGDRLSPIWK